MSLRWVLGRSMTARGAHGAKKIDGIFQKRCFHMAWDLSSLLKGGQGSEGHGTLIDGCLSSVRVLSFLAAHASPDCTT